METITIKDINEIYGRRDQDLSEKDHDLVVRWANEKMMSIKQDWSDMCTEKEKTCPCSLCLSLAEFMAMDITPEVLEMLFWGKSLTRCCERHAGSCPIMIDSDETTPASNVFSECKECRRHDLRIIQRAYKLQAWCLHGI